jgi:hypothetical protein
MYLAVVLAGLLTWWRPDYRTWGALIGGLMTAMLLWLCWRMVSIDRTVPGHPIYLVLLPPAGILTYHLACTGLGGVVDNEYLISGALNASLLFHLAMLALGVMLSQSLLPKAITHAGVVRVCGAAMIGGGVFAGFRASAEPVREAMSLVGYGGVAVWLAPVWRPSISSPDQGFAPSRYRGVFKVCSLAAAVPASGLLAWNCPPAAIFASIGAGVTLVTASVIFSRRSRELLAAGAILAIGGSICAMCGVSGLQGLSFDGPLLGSGEAAFGQMIQGQRVLQAVSAHDSGLQILCRTIGAPAAMLTAAGLAGCLVMLMIRARRDHSGDKAQCVAWTVASLLCAGALLNRGGLFVPAVVLAFGLTWGLAAEAAGRSSRPRPGITVLVVLVAIMVLMGVARSNGLLIWAANSLCPKAGGDKLLHAVFGMLLSMTLAWLMGARSLRRGLTGIGLACLVGGAGELVQYLTTTGRSVEWTDWGAHAAGSIAALGPYLLCLGARQCESPDATGHTPQVRDPYVG